MVTTKITRQVYCLLLSLLLAATVGYTVFRSHSFFSSLSPLSLYNQHFKGPAPPIRSSGDELGLLLEAAAMPDKTVIITVINDAYTEQGLRSETAILDLFLESFWLGEDTRHLLDHLLIGVVNQGAYERCIFKRLNCYRIPMEGEFWGEQSVLFRKLTFGSMMWGRVLFQLDVLRRRYNILFTDGDVLWLRNPFPRLSDHDGTLELQIAQDWSWRSASINTGFYLVRSNNRTISLFEKWYSTRDRFIKQDQEALIWLLQHGFLQKLGLRWKFLDNQYISGFAEPTFSIATVNTVHSTDCCGVENKMNALTVVLRDWKRFKEAIARKNNESFVGDMAAGFEWSPRVSCKRPLRKYQPRKGT